VLFVRHPLLDVVFRLLAILGLAGLGLLSGDKVLIALPVLMLMGLPLAWRLARGTHRLRQEGVFANFTDAPAIPPATALRILTELRAALPGWTNARLLAQQVADVFEALNARPPGVLVSLALLAIQAGSFLAAFVLAVLFTLAQRVPTG